MPVVSLDDLLQLAAHVFTQALRLTGDNGQPLVQEGGFQRGVGFAGDVILRGEVAQQFLAAAEHEGILPLQNGADFLADHREALKGEGHHRHAAQQQADYQSSFTGNHTVGLLPYLGLNTDYIRNILQDYADKSGSLFAETTYVMEGEMPALEADKFALRASRIEIPASITGCQFYRKLGYDYKNGIKALDAEQHYPLEKFTDPE